MLTLALDTTTKAGSVAVADHDELLALVHGDATRTHGERLPEEIERALNAAGITSGELTLLAVATGPGAFTGLRIGLATMQGLAMVTGCPVVGVSALDAMASASFERAEQSLSAIATWMDAQRGEVFAACYSLSEQTAGAPRALSDPIVAIPEVVLAALPVDLVRHTRFVGDGAVRYQSEIARLTADTGQVGEPPAALAPYIARLGQHFAARGLAGPPHALQPLYVRRPDAELTRSLGEMKNELPR